MTGNTLGLSKAPNLNCPGVGGSIGTFITDDAYSIDDYPESACSEDWPLGTTQYWAENSSSGQLDLPPEGTVLYAELIWGGSYFYGDEDVSDYIGLTDTIDLYYEEGSVISVAPDPATAFTTPEEMWSPSGFYIHYYVRSAEVTDFVRTNGSGVYSVGAVPATQDYHINSLNTAGWILVVAYQSVQMATRNLSIFVGGDWVDERASVDYSVSGFCTPPTGPVDGLVLIGAMEGDAELVGDTASVGAVGFPFVQLESPNNPIDNFFASQINDIYGYLDTRGTFGLRNHDPDPVTGSNYVGGRQGWDITGVFLSSDEGHLHNDQTSATLRVTSANAAADSYLTMMVSFEIDINAPFFDVAGASSVTPDEADVGQLLSYEFILDNTGSADAEEVVFYHPLPEGLALVELVLDSVPMTGVSTGDLATGVGIGTVPNYDFVILELQAEVESLPPAPDPAQFLTQARWEYVYHSCGTDPVIESQSLAGPLLVLLPRIEASLQAAPSAEVAPGDFVTLALTVENTGEASTSDAKLVVDIPDGLTYLAGSTTLNGSAIGDVAGDMPFADPASIHSPGESAGDVAPAESAVVTFQVEVDAGSAPSEPLIIAQVDSDGSGPAPAVSAELALNVVEPPESCGNGLIESGEACDDGNAVGGDGCSRTCQEEPGYDCQGEPSVCEHTCGNGDLDPGEECDDGDTLGGDGCDESCQEEPGYDCQGEPSVCEYACGNGELDPGEECDDGDTLGGDGCDESCQEEPGYDCQGEPSVCEPTCGNGVLDPTEGCDDGNNTAGDGCSHICQVESGYVCEGEPSDCTRTCGNGRLDGTEECDDGNTQDGDGCDSICQVEPGYDCVGQPSDCTTTCGNGRLDSGEDCDDGNTTPGDGCSSNCEVEYGYSCQGQPSVCSMSCGNGIINEGEGCDDGNLMPGDGCSSVCQVESGYVCEGEPSVCSQDSDNDGLSDDDENQIGTDPYHPDTDGDGLSDGTEVHGENPTDPLDSDSDDDQLCDGPVDLPPDCHNGEDTNADGRRDENETDPNDGDTDDGSVPDGEEVNRGTDPLDPSDDVVGGALSGPEACSCSSSSRRDVEKGLSLLWLVLALAASRRRRRFDGSPGPS